MNLIVLLFAIAANAAASALVKSATIRLAGSYGLASLVGNGHLVLAVVFYGAAFALYALALTRMPLNVAQPIITSGTILVVGLMSSAAFQELFSWPQLCGYGLVVIGIGLIGWSKMFT